MECSFDGCHRGIRAKGLCASHYNQRRSGQELTALPDGDGYLVAKFWSLVDKNQECWTWRAGTSTSGYGVIEHQGVRIRAHRLSYELFRSPIPQGMYVDHICHNRACVRPEHLRLASHKQNGENQSGLRVDNHSGVRGVSWDQRSGKWHVQVKHGGKRVHSRLFESLDDAEADAIAKRNELFTHNNIDRKLGQA